MEAPRIEDDGPIAMRDGRLWVEGISAAALARQFGTPLYVVSEARLRANARMWADALKHAWPYGPSVVMPSLKANTSIALRRILNDEGLGCDVFGRHEFELALLAGVRVEKISVNGATKPDDVLALAIDRGAMLTLDSLDEIRRTEVIAQAAGKVAIVRLRLRPWLAASTASSDFSGDSYPAHLAVQDYRAGMPFQDACESAVLGCASAHIDLAGVAAHVSRQTTDLSFWAAFGTDMSRQIEELRAAAPSWRPREIDLGGGFALPRDPAARALGGRDEAAATPTPQEYLQAIVEPLDVGLRAQGLAPQDITLQIEPGRAVYGDAGVHLTTVRNVKRQLEPVPRAWIETDTSEAFLADTYIEHNDWTIIAAEPTERDGEIDAAITGISCGWDILSAPRTRPAYQVGDVLTFLDTGAYQDATASNFNAMGRPATILVSGDNAEIIKAAETFEDLMARERIPARLAGATV
ncbi:MAG TPA: hypothetical protein VNT22_07750 [Baekduia sp.]|nr:hypothetical protein [Baekduia sp.]